MHRWRLASLSAIMVAVASVSAVGASPARRGRAAKAKVALQQQAEKKNAASRKSAPSKESKSDSPANVARPDWGKVTGWVVDAASRKPIPDAEISVEVKGEFPEAGRGTAHTDPGGRYVAHAPLGRISASVDMMRLLTMHPFSLLFSPKAMMKETRIVDADRLNLRVTCPGYRPFLGSVRASEENAETYSIRMEDVWLAPLASSLASFSPDNYQHERIESFSVTPAVCGPGETVTVTLVARLPVDRKEKYTAFLTSNNPRLIGNDQSLKMQPMSEDYPDRVVFSRAVKVEPKPNERYAELGFYLVRNERTQLVEAETRVLFQSVISPEEKAAAALVDEGYRQARAGEFDNALQRYSAARAAAPRYTLAHLLYGDLCLKVGRSEEAAEAYAKLVELSPEDWDVARPRHILALIQSGNLSDAAEEVKSADQQKRALSPQIYLYRARIAALQGRFDDADRDLTRAGQLTRIPASTTVEINLRRMQAAVAAQPESADLHLAYARVLGSANRWNEAAEQIRQALRLTPQDPWGWLDLAGALRQLDRDDEAHAALQRALQLDPKNSETRLALAESLQQRGDADGALSFFRELAAEEPNNVRAHRGLALCLLQKDDRPSCKRELAEVVQLTRNKGATEDQAMPISFQAIYFGPKRRFVSGYADGQGAASRVILDCLDTLDHNPQNALAWMNVGGALVQLGAGEMALNALDKAAALDPDMLDTHYYRALALRQVGQPDAARRELQAVVAANPLHPRARLQLASLLTEQGEVQQAQLEILAHAKNYPEERTTGNALAP